MPAYVAGFLRSVNRRTFTTDPKGIERSAGSSVDAFSPPVVLGTVFLMLFGLGAADAYLASETDRLRSALVFYLGISPEPLVYLVVSFCCFVLGYLLKPAAAVTRHLRPGRREWVPLPFTVVTTVSFIITFGVLVIYTLTVGYGRYEAEGSGTLQNLSLLGELSLIPYALSLVRDAHRRSGEARSQMSQWDRNFLWGFMFPAQVTLSIAVGTRSRVVTVVLMALAAHHYGAGRLRHRTLVAAAVILLLVVVPVLGTIRSETGSGFGLRSAWESLAGRTSAVESFTIIYQNLDTAPEPDPLYWTVLTGLVPRFLWPSKPQSDAAERFTYWAVGMHRSWAGPTLPGEFLMLFGYAGGLAGMAILGIGWRFLSEIARLGEKDAWTTLYIVALPTLLTVESGFVLPYSVLTRLVAVTVVILLASTAPARRQLGGRHGVVAKGRALRVSVEPALPHGTVTASR